MNTKMKLSAKMLTLGVVILSSFSVLFLIPTHKALAVYAVPTCNSATLTGTINPYGVATSVWFEWGPGSTLTNVTATQTFSTTSNYSAVITGLTENSLYSYRAMASNQYGTSTGQTLNFWTATCTPPPPTTYAVTSTAGNNGTISPLGTQQVNAGSTTSFTVTPNYGYTGSVSGCNGIAINNITNPTTYTTGTINSTCTVNATFTQNPPTQYLVTSTGSGIGGNITPPSVTVNSGNSTSFTVTPNSGYTGSVYGCNGSQMNNITSATTYNTGAIYSACTVYASFTQNTPNPATGSLTISPSSCIITSGASTCTVTGATWTTTNATNPMLIDGNTGATLSTAANNTNPLLVYVGYPYTIYNLRNGSTVLDVKSASSSCANGSSWNGSICAQNAPTTFTVSTNAGTGGSIAPTSQQVNSGNTATFYVTANQGYSINNVSGCNGYLNGNTFTTGAITSNCTVNASFNFNNPQGPTVQLIANPASIQQGGNSTLTWTSQNATSCNAYWTTNTNPNGSGVVVPTVTTPYVINCVNSTGQQTSATVTVYVNQATAPTVQLTANPTSIQQGGNSTLTWNSQNATSCNAYWTGSNSTSGSGIVVPTVTTPYVINCVNSTGQQASATVTVYVNSQTQNPTVSIYSSPASVSYNGTSLVTWNSQNANYCTGTNGTNGWIGSKSTSGTFYTGNLTYTTNFDIVCTNSTGQQANATTSVYVNNQTQYPAVTIYANPVSVPYNGTSLIIWNSTNASTCSATNGTNGWGGNRSTSGSFYTGNLTSATNYGITCTNSTGQQANASATVNVDNQQIVGNQPTVVIYSDKTNLDYNGSATVRWITTNATSCNASGGSVGWAGVKSIGPGSFYTGSLTSSKTYEITCSNAFGSASDTVTINVGGLTNRTPVAPSSLVLITSSVDRNQPIVPTIDNTMPKPGDEINYTVSYQNIGNAAITNLTLQMNLPLEVDYIFSNPSNPSISGNTLYFNLGTLRANGKGVVTVRVRVRDNIKAGTNLNFPATLSYVDPSGQPQSVSANVSAQVYSDGTNTNFLGANVFGAGFFPTNIFGWLLLLVLILILVLLAKYLLDQSFRKKTTTVTDQPSGKKTTTTTLQ